MQARGRGVVLPPIGVAFDGDVGRRIDAVLGIAMLNGLAAKGEARRITLTVSTPSLKTVQIADVVASFYTPRPAVAATGGGVGAAREGMIGMPDGPAGKDDPPLAALLATYQSAIAGISDTPDSAVLIRNLLLAQNDGNAAIVLAGPATSLARLAALYRAVPQLVAKVKHVVVALGAFSGTAAVDPSITQDLASAKTLFADWPTPLVAVGAEVGTALPYPGASLDRDFAWTTGPHPVVDAYRAFKPMPYDAPAGALAALLYAVHPTDGYFKTSDAGTISVGDDGRTRFTPNAEGRHRHLIVDPAQNDRIIKLYTELVSAKPIPRPARGRGGAPEADA